MSRLANTAPLRDALDAVLTQRQETNKREGELRGRYERSWNEEFQQLMDNKKDNLEKYRRLRHLAQDFVFTAETYGKLIIAERYDACPFHARCVCLCCVYVCVSEDMCELFVLCSTV
jgi:Clustered mitochondria